MEGFFEKIKGLCVLCVLKNEMYCKPKLYASGFVIFGFISGVICGIVI